MKDEDFKKVLELHETSVANVVYLPDYQFKQLSDNPICQSVKVGDIWYVRESDKR
jgi:hypothetical protein